MACRLSPEAEADLLEIWHYVATDGSVEVADRLVDSITGRFALLAQYPRAGRERPELREGVRSFSVGEYLLLYRLAGDDVLIQRVVRGSRDLGALFGE